MPQYRTYQTAAMSPHRSNEKPLLLAMAITLMALVHTTTDQTQTHPLDRSQIIVWDFSSKSRKGKSLLLAQF